MRFSVKAVKITFALLWGGCLLLVELANLADASYGGKLLGMMSSVYSSSSKP